MTLEPLDQQQTQVHAYAFASGETPPHERTEDNHSGIPFSGDIAGIELRMLPPLVRDNHTIKCWPFPGRAKLYCLTMVVSDAANQLSGLMDLNAFPRIGDQEYLPINKTIYYWQEDGHPDNRPPSQLHVISSIIKSKEALRETADVLSKVKDDQGYQDLLGKLGEAIHNVSSFNAVTGLTLQAAHIVGRYLGRVDDQPIGTVVNSFTRLHGDWDRLGINQIHIPTRDVAFHFELTIRDQYRQDLVRQGKLALPVSYYPPAGVEQMMRM